MTATRTSVRSLITVLALAACAAPVLSADAPLASDEQIAAAERAPLVPMAAEQHWNDAFAPFNVIGNVYYVGTAELGSYLIATPKGHFLIDGALPQTPPQILANIRALGFDIRDVKYLLNSHAHFDHAGGLAALQRASGAAMVASAGDRGALEKGRVDYGPSADIAFPPVRVNRVVGDGDTLALGGVTMTAHMTPGHTQGCTSWSTHVAGTDGAAHDVFFHCSSTVAGQSLVPEAYPGMIESFRATFARVRSLQADVFLAFHAAFFDLSGKRAKQTAGDANAFVDPDALQNFNAAMERAFDKELASQQAKASSARP